MSGDDPRAIVRLDRCPRCDYDLSGLPRRHTCPECGQAYDEHSFVLESKPRGSSYWESQFTWLFVMLFPVIIVLFGVMGRPLGGFFFVYMVLLYIALRLLIWGLQRLRQRPGKALFIWVNADGVALQPAFRWKRRAPWSAFRRPNALPAPKFLPRSDPGRWRLRLRPRWPRLLIDKGIDVHVTCSKREIALVRNTMRRLRAAAWQRGGRRRQSS